MFSFNTGYENFHGVGTQRGEARGTTYSARIKAPEKEAMPKTHPNNKKCNNPKMQTTAPPVSQKGWFRPEYFARLGVSRLRDVTDSR